ncbi:MAG: T9SS type A sorting domain-containing protein [Bacteroidetes bacterium]|nr:T9SS type A sorting domain-containing protein [Bacteroidota bacterium]
MRLVSSVILIILIGLLSMQASAQLVFTRVDIEAEMSDRTLTVFSINELTDTRFDLGASGSGQTYDFTGFDFEMTEIQSTVLAPDMTPYAVDFPNATYAQLVGEENVAFIYTRLDDQGFYDLGFAAEVQGMDYILKHDPEMPSILFPMQLGSSWSYEGREVSPMEGFYNTTDMQIEVVSEGTILTDMGSWPALCIRNTSYTTTRIEFSGNVISEDVMMSVDYMFMTKAGISGTVSVDTLEAQSWNPLVTDVSLRADQTLSAGTITPAPVEVSIQSVYPHPVTADVTTVHWNASGPATLTLHDNCGRELRRLSVDGSSGTYMRTRLATRDLPTGMYFLRVTAREGLAQRPILIMH